MKDALLFTKFFKFIILSLFAILISSGCSNTVLISSGGTNTILISPTPTTTTNPKLNHKHIYPDYRYLKQEGSGRSAEEARKHAIRNLSQRIESRVVSEFEKSINVLKDNKKENVKEASSSILRIESSLELKGVETVIDRFDKGIYYALALLDKNIAGDIWKRELDNKLTEIKNEYAKLKRLKGYIKRLILLKKIHKLWIEQEVISSRLRVLGNKLQRKFDILPVLRLIREIETNLRIYVSVEYGVDSELKKELESENALTEYVDKIKTRISELVAKNFSVTPMDIDSNLTIKGNVKIKPLRKRNKRGSKFVETSIKITIRDLNSLDVLVISKSSSSQRSSYEEAVKQSLKKISYSVEDEIKTYFEL